MARAAATALSFASKPRRTAPPARPALTRAVRVRAPSLAAYQGHNPSAAIAKRAASRSARPETHATDSVLRGKSAHRPAAATEDAGDAPSLRAARRSAIVAHRCKSTFVTW